jgi:methyltransferase (TIGR00027 family)
MKPGRESQTAVLVCMARAMAHGTTGEARFADPAALALLPAEARARVERYRAGAAPDSLRGRAARSIHQRRAKVLVARTVAIDEAVRDAGAPQLVILGAGLDSRAWRMPELRNVTVFEVDHPDTQRQKRERAAALAQVAREVRFVPVDFTQGGLDAALAAAGHDPARATTWIWEGVVMYLSRAEIGATLGVLGGRSPAGSRVIMDYHRPALMLRLTGPLFRRLGEPLRSAFRPDAVRALLDAHGFAVVRDEDVRAIGGRLSPDVARATRPMTHMRIVTAARRRDG